MKWKRIRDVRQATYWLNMELLLLSMEMFVLHIYTLQKALRSDSTMSIYLLHYAPAACSVIYFMLVHICQEHLFPEFCRGE